MINLRSNSHVLVLILVSSFLFGCSSTTSIEETPAQLFEGMGDHRRLMTTDSEEAQEFFGQGMAWLYAFNHDEAIRSFKHAATLDPEAAMPWWGIAICEGPNYNDPVMTEERSAAAYEAAQEALARIGNTDPVERALIRAISTRYTKPWPKDRSKLDQAYANAMAEVWAMFPNDSDVGTLCAESKMVQRPWKLYSGDGEPEGDTNEIVAILERVLALDPNNPGTNHLYIHAVEPSRNPGVALEAADRLCNQMPGSGHMLHMPSHIYVQVGQWEKSIVQNSKSLEADKRYLTLSPNQGVQHMYIAHNAHMLAYSAMMIGREAEAMRAARAMWAGIPHDMLKNVAPYIDLWMTSVYDVQKRFGRWDAILAEPAPPEFLSITTAMWHAHRAIAFAAKKDFVRADKERKLFHKKQAAMPKDSVFGPDPIERILKVSEFFIDGEIALQKSLWDKAASLLIKAVEVETSLSYGEPPQFLQPTRHTLGAVYLKAHRYADAERVYRADLKKWPGNGWSLFGLARALELQGKTAEADTIKKQYQEVWSKADEPTTTSCKCLLDT